LKSCLCMFSAKIWQYLMLSFLSWPNHKTNSIFSQKDWVGYA
jgi:hypothetical protein